MRERGLHLGVMPCWRGTFAQPITSSPHDLSACKNTNNFITRLLFMIYFFTKKTYPYIFFRFQHHVSRHRSSKPLAKTRRNAEVILSVTKYIEMQPHHPITPSLHH